MSVTSCFADQFEKIALDLSMEGVWDAASGLLSSTTASDVARGLDRESMLFRISPRVWASHKIGQGRRMLRRGRREWSPGEQGTDIRYGAPAVLGAGVGTLAGLPLGLGVRKLTRGRRFIRGPGAILAAALPIAGAIGGATAGQIGAIDRAESDWENMSPVEKFQTIWGMT